jgi:hypothetical protein
VLFNIHIFPLYGAFVLPLCHSFVITWLLQRKTNICRQIFVSVNYLDSFLLSVLPSLKIHFLHLIVALSSWWISQRDGYVWILLQVLYFPIKALYLILLLGRRSYFVILKSVLKCLYCGNRFNRLQELQSSELKVYFFYRNVCVCERGCECLLKNYICPRWYLFWPHFCNKFVFILYSQINNIMVTCAACFLFLFSIRDFTS